MSTPQRAGGQARQAQLRAQLGEAGYRAYQRSLFERAITRHGPQRMRAVLTQAHEARRCWRIANPTPAEALLHWIALESGFTLHADLTGEFEWTRYRAEPTRWAWQPDDAIIEARVLGYACDLLLPISALAIEVVGGIHLLTTARDRARQDAIQRAGVHIITLTNEQVYRAEADILFQQILEVRRAA
jgi:hypothetical protein